MEHCSEKNMNRISSAPYDDKLRAVEVRGLSFTYEGCDAPALSDISFTVEAGGFLTVCGASGCGKSTLLRQLRSCLTPSGKQTGEVLFFGGLLSGYDEREQTGRIAYVSQSVEAQCVTDKVWHELAFTLESLGADRELISRRIAETAAYFGIEELLGRSTDELSGGQKQIISLAAAMTVQPELLLLDEPTSQLDPVAAFEFVSLLGRINRELSTTVMICEHSLGELLPLSTGVLVLSEGRVVCCGTPQDCAAELFRKRDRAFLSFPAAARIACCSGLSADGEIPLSVAQGREYLRKTIKKRGCEPVPLREYSSKGKPLVTMKDIFFRYEKDSPDILKGLSLEIYSGEQLCILGGNGSGKSTLLNVISGVLRAYSGKLRLYGEGKSLRTAYMPQEPTLLFTAGTVHDELYDTAKEFSCSEEETERIISLCRLEGLGSRHPFDISGGEAQRLALAKLLLTSPQLMLLDEPAKGLDSADKRLLADIIKELCKNGTSVVTVTHDTEYAAMYAQRCAMLFNGRIVSCAPAQRFFCQNGLYTTESARISGGMIENAVTPDDVMSSLGAEYTDNDFTPPPPAGRDKPLPVQNDIPRRKGPRLILNAALLAVFAVFLAVSADILYLPFFSQTKWAAFGVLFLSALMLMISAGKGMGRLKIKPVGKSKGRAAASALLILAAVPLTVIWGVYLLDGTKYIFISLLILFESMAAFHIMLGSGRLRTRELVITALLCALCTAGRAAFYMLPACKPVTAVVILASVSLGSEAGFLTGMTSMLVSNIFFGQGVWTPWQMLAMGLVGYITGLLFTGGIIPSSRRTLTVWGFIAALVIYGGIMDPTSLIISGMPLSAGALSAVYAAGLPLNTIHAVTTAVFVYMLAEPMILRLERLKTKYRLLQQD